MECPCFFFLSSLLSLLSGLMCRVPAPTRALGGHSPIPLTPSPVAVVQTRLLAGRRTVREQRPASVLWGDFIFIHIHHGRRLMMRFVPILAASFLARCRVCYGFSSSTQAKRFASTSLRLLPTEESVKNDEFMQQLGHASQIIPLLHPEEGDEISPENVENLKCVLARQLVRHFHNIIELPCIRTLNHQ